MERCGKKHNLHGRRLYKHKRLKSKPGTSSDIFCDWREEVIYPLTTNDALRVYTTNIPSEYKIKSLMFDSVYRSGVASEQSAYTSLLM